MPVHDLLLLAEMCSQYRHRGLGGWIVILMLRGDSFAPFGSFDDFAVLHSGMPGQSPLLESLSGAAALHLRLRLAAFSKASFSCSLTQSEYFHSRVSMTVTPLTFAQATHFVSVTSRSSFRQSPTRDRSIVLERDVPIPSNPTRNHHDDHTP